MAPRKTPVKKDPNAETPALGLPDNKEADERQAAADLEASKVAPKVSKKEAVKQEFSHLKLKMLGDGLFKYECFEVNAFDKSILAGDSAKNYGMRKGDIVHVHDNNDVKTIVV